MELKRNEIKITKPEHSAAKKADVITLYQDNNFDIEKTAKQANVSITLVREWFKESGLDFFKNKTEEAIILQSSNLDDIEKKRTALSIKILEDREIIQERMMTLAEKSDNLADVTKAYDAMTRAIKEDREESGGSGGGTKKKTMLNIINNQYNTRKQIIKDGKNKA